MGDKTDIEALMLRNGFNPGWHYTPLDVKTLAYGRLHVTWLPDGLRGVADTLGIEYGRYDLHTAVGDAMLCRDVYNHLAREAE